MTHSKNCQDFVSTGGWHVKGDWAGISGDIGSIQIIHRPVKDSHGLDFIIRAMGFTDVFKWGDIQESDIF